MIFLQLQKKAKNYRPTKLSINKVTVVWKKQGQTNTFGKTCPWAGDVYKLLFQHNELFVPNCIIAGCKESQFYSLGQL